MPVIDRFEGDYAVIEIAPGKNRNVPKALLPREAHEGDVVVAVKGGRYEVDKEETERRRQKIKKQMGGLFK